MNAWGAHLTFFMCMHTQRHEQTYWQKKKKPNESQKTKVMKMVTNELENHAGANIENNGICAFRRDGKG